MVVTADMAALEDPIFGLHTSAQGTCVAVTGIFISTTPDMEEIITNGNVAHRIQVVAFN